ncbi:unnamed protein product [Dicrocoelium dendriticum]|nr:unnamed protein product [Dicrocoelium dendriticum]
MAWHAWLPPADRRLGAIATLLSIGFFNSLDRLLSGFVPPYEVASKGPNQIMKWRNLVVSWIHALLVGSWDILWVFLV